MRIRTEESRPRECLSPLPGGAPRQAPGAGSDRGRRASAHVEGLAVCEAQGGPRAPKEPSRIRTETSRHESACLPLPGALRAKRWADCAGAGGATEDRRRALRALARRALRDRVCGSEPCAEGAVARRCRATRVLVASTRGASRQAGRTCAPSRRASTVLVSSTRGRSAPSAGRTARTSVARRGCLSPLPGGAPRRAPGGGCDRRTRERPRTSGGLALCASTGGPRAPQEPSRIRTRRCCVGGVAPRLVLVADYPGIGGRTPPGPVRSTGNSPRGPSENTERAEDLYAGAFAPMPRRTRSSVAPRECLLPLPGRFRAGRRGGRDRGSRTPPHVEGLAVCEAPGGPSAPQEPSWIRTVARSAASRECLPTDSEVGGSRTRLLVPREWKARLCGVDTRGRYRPTTASTASIPGEAGMDAPSTSARRTRSTALATHAFRGRILGARSRAGRGWG